MKSFGPFWVLLIATALFRSNWSFFFIYINDVTFYDSRHFSDMTYERRVKQICFGRRWKSVVRLEERWKRWSDEDVTLWSYTHRGPTAYCLHNVPLHLSHCPVLFDFNKLGEISMQTTQGVAYFFVCWCLLKLIKRKQGLQMRWRVH